MTTIIIGGAGNTEGNSDCASAETVEEVWCSQQYGFGNFHERSGWVVVLGNE
jgi:hypothetical protein